MEKLCTDNLSKIEIANYSTFSRYGNKYKLKLIYENGSIESQKIIIKNDKDFYLLNEFLTNALKKNNLSLKIFRNINSISIINYLLLIFLFLMGLVGIYFGIYIHLITIFLVFTLYFYSKRWINNFAYETTHANLDEVENIMNKYALPFRCEEFKFHR